MKFIHMMAGVSGSGKSRYIEKKLAKTHKVYSSDNIRLELFNELIQENNNKVFQTLHDRILNDDGLLVYDSTNLNRRYRRHFYDLVKRDKTSMMSIILTIEPFSQILKNNQRKPVEEQVSEDVLRKMYINFQPPRKGIDCDDYSIVSHVKFFRRVMTREELLSINNVNELLEYLSPAYKRELSNLKLNHDTPHHLENIDEHINMCIDNSDNDYMKIISLFHDLGKAFTKEGGTYHGHENISAMYALKALREIPNLKMDIELIVETIYQHMNAHRGITDKVIKRNGLDDVTLKSIEEFKNIDEVNRIAR